MVLETMAGLELLRSSCSRGRVIVEASFDSPTVCVTLLVPTKESGGLLEKLYSVEPFKGKHQIFNLSVGTLRFWQNRVCKYTAHSVD